MVFPVPGEPLSAGHVVLFGKLPSHGDFVSRGLAEDFRKAWDDWLSSCLERGRLAFGERFAQAHDVAPPWRFVNGPGDFGSAWRVGAFAPSVDSAGRRFFIMVAVDDLDAVTASTSGLALAGLMEA